MRVQPLGCARPQPRPVARHTRRALSLSAHVQPAFLARPPLSSGTRPGRPLRLRLPTPRTARRRRPSNSCRGAAFWWPPRAAATRPPKGPLCRPHSRVAAPNCRGRPQLARSTIGRRVGAPSGGEGGKLKCASIVHSCARRPPRSCTN